MTASDNKQLLRAAYAALAAGDARPFVHLMADDFTFTIEGHGAWSRTWRGKAEVRERLFGPLFAQFATRYTSTAQRFVAEDDLVVVECRGDVTTTRGDRYDNHYCNVCRFRDGRLVALTEYGDTELIATVLAPPPA